MTMFALTPSRITIVSIDLRCTTPVPPIAIGRPASSPLDRLPKQAFNTLRQYAAGAEIPIASDARPLHTSRGFLPWRFAYAGPRVRRATIMGPASAHLHTSGSRGLAAGCLLCPQERTSSGCLGMSEKCHFRTHAPYAIASFIRLSDRHKRVASAAD